jgi:1,4-dihydroxy-2-naphthoyl-CoA hydrolase
MTTSRRQPSLWRPGSTLAQLSDRSRATLSAHLGIEFTELGPDFLCGTMPVDERTCQPTRILHGGASVVLAETLASLAANLVIDDTRYACVGQEINANHLRPVPVGQIVTGTARAIHIGARSQVWGVEIVNNAGRLTCISRITMAVIGRAPAAGAA